MINNLGRTLQDNPAPLLVIGAGIAWMMAATKPYVASDGSYRAREERWRQRRAEPRREGAASDNATDDFRTGASDWTGDDGPEWSVGSAADAARRTGARVAHGMSSAADSARRAGEQVADGISAAAGAAADTAAELGDAARRRMHDMRDSAYGTGSAAYRSTQDFIGSASDMLRDQPFVFGALGLALGAALGAALPESELEDQLMGEASDAVKTRAGEAAAAGYDKARTVAEKTWDRASREAEAQGLTTEKAGEALSDVGERVSSVWQATKDGVREEAERQGLMSDDAGQADKERVRPGAAPEAS
jgi:ElaB/YqjD/DUF883 family membrane-anchored ribosome-binding protein